MEPKPEVAELMQNIHRYACARRGLDPHARGSHQQIRNELGLSQAMYAQLYRGRTSEDRALRVAAELGVDPGDASPLWLELRRLLDDMEAHGLEVDAVRAALPPM